MTPATLLGFTRGASGREYAVCEAAGACAECGAPFGVRFVIDPDDAIPEVGFLHTGGKPVHKLTMTGDSEAARALRDGHVISQSQETLPK